MYKYKQIILGITLSILVATTFSGCMQPFSPNKKYVIRENTNSYEVPYSTKGAVLGSNHSFIIDGLNSLHYNGCDYGDYWWEAVKSNGSDITTDNMKNNPYNLEECEACNKKPSEATNKEKFEGNEFVSKKYAWDFLEKRKNRLTGCSKPIGAESNPYVVKFIAGKAFKIRKYFMNAQGIITQADVNFLTNQGVDNCRVGDVIWMTMNTNIPEYYGHFYKIGKMGCTSPLSEQEYNHLTNQNNSNQRYKAQSTQFEHKKQADERAAQKKQSQENLNKSLDRLNDSANANKPVNVNVYHY